MCCDLCLGTDKHKIFKKDHSQHTVHSVSNAVEEDGSEAHSHDAIRHLGMDVETTCSLSSVVNATVKEVDSVFAFFVTLCMNM